jgi:hypothetical protein
LARSHSACRSVTISAAPSDSSCSSSSPGKRFASSLVDDRRVHLGIGAKLIGDAIGALAA